MQSSESVTNQNTGFSCKNLRMFNVNNIGVVRYKTVKVATLVSVIQVVVFTHHVSSPYARSRSPSLSVCLTVVGVVASS